MADPRAFLSALRGDAMPQSVRTAGPSSVKQLPAGALAKLTAKPATAATAATAKPATAATAATATAKPATATAKPATATAKPATATAKPATATAKPATAVTAKPATAVEGLAAEQFDESTEISAPLRSFAPVISPQFQTFMMMNYFKYSPNQQRVFALLQQGASKEDINALIAAEQAAKRADPDACKNRPSKIETFYYQSLVRAYMSYGTPYRGLLVYHGLGTGKTCTSIAAAEALYWGGRKTIYILTPASLSDNYRKDLAKCGYYPFRKDNHWQFMAAPADSPAYAWLTDTFGLPPKWVRENSGGWVPTPGASNWATLGAKQEVINEQISAHMNHRFKFIHYNGVPAAKLAEEAFKSLYPEGRAGPLGKSLFDDAVIVIDEVHNLVRTINGTRIVTEIKMEEKKNKKGVTKMKKKTVTKTIWQYMNTVEDSAGARFAADEPHEPVWTMPKYSPANFADKDSPHRYPRGYILYRLLQNAIGAKIIALSATPMINYPQEFAILLNIIGGEQRMAAFTTKAPVDTIADWAEKNPGVYYYGLRTVGGSRILEITPPPCGYSKVVIDKELRLVRSEHEYERRFSEWVSEMAAVVPGGTTVTTHTYPMLPDDGQVFVDNFVNKEAKGDQAILTRTTILKNRATGLISYYAGGSEELMPRKTIHEVPLEMGAYMFEKYSEARGKELKMKKQTVNPNASLFDQATSSPDSGFLALSRAACNFVFPEAVKRPQITVKQMKQLEGKEEIIAVDRDVQLGGGSEDEAEAEAEAEGEAEDEAEAEDEGEDEEEEKEEGAEGAEPVSQIEETWAALAAHFAAAARLDDEIKRLSPKYLAIRKKIEESKGPALVYSNYKTLEGLGIFKITLEAHGYVPLKLEKVGAEWSIAAASTAGSKRYIMYTGDQDREERKLLLQIYNADFASLPPRLRDQCKALLQDEPDKDNRNGTLCRIFMITQSGAEGISLMNTRQVHIMEPYWNNVRIQQVIGRAIRLCSHMYLDPADRHVDVYNYIATFTPAQIKDGGKAFMGQSKDNGKTTDQMLFNIAQKKQKLADELFSIAQTAAIDCELHIMEHGNGLKCYKYEAQSNFIYHPNWEEDLNVQTY
uniref:Helicase ATP-binding domain-containing protein n=1 Tax=viral metagenome TaxID=1070528 RepID=A0A6C0E6M4_9ZZZZ